MKKRFVEIFGDMIYFNDLIVSILIISTTTMSAHLFAPSNNRPLGLLFGLSGTVIGFIIVLSFIKPKRMIKMEDNHD